MVLHSLLELVRDYTCRKRGINNKRDQRNKVIKALFGDGSRDRIKYAEHGMPIGNDQMLVQNQIFRELLV